MVRQANDFDEDVFRLLGFEETEQPDINDVIHSITGQERLRFYDPLTPILNRQKLNNINKNGEN